MEELEMMETCRFGVRRDANGTSPVCFEVFDRMAGTTVASEMSRIEAEAEARRRNHDPSGEPGEPPRVAAPSTPS